MEAARTSETSVDNYFTRQYIPEDKSELHTRRRENLKSHMDMSVHFWFCSVVRSSTVKCWRGLETLHYFCSWQTQRLGSVMFSNSLEEEIKKEGVNDSPASFTSKQFPK
jgi:hypothetical protein